MSNTVIADGTTAILLAFGISPKLKPLGAKFYLRVGKTLRSVSAYYEGLQLN